MTDKKTPDESFIEIAKKCSEELTLDFEYFRRAFLAGRADFITSELPKLLEMAREGVFMGACNLWHWEHEIADLIAMAEKGETWNEVTAKP